MAIIKVPRGWWGGGRALAPTAPDSDGLAAFGPEDAPAGGERQPARPATKNRPLWLGAAALVVLGLAAAGFLEYQRRVLAAVPPTGQMTLETSPEGLDVTIEGTHRGRTPLTLALAPGTYDVLLGAGAEQRTVSVTLAAGMTLVQRVDFAPVAATTLGALTIETEPSGLPVAVDGEDRGVSPLTVKDLPAGEHEVRIGRSVSAVRRRVTVAAGETHSLIVSAAAPAVVTGGWVSIAAAAPLEVRQGGQAVGSSELDRVMLPAGTHVLELTNDALGFRGERRVTITPGQTTRLSIEMPQGVLSINATPWADVSIGDRSLGQTPIGNVRVPIGTHEIVFRHPDLGERRQTVTVTLRQPARLGVDMRRP